MRISAHEHHLARLDVARADLDAQGNALHLPLVELPAGAVVGDVCVGADARRLQFRLEVGGGFQDARLFGGDGDDDRLHGRDHGRDDQPALVAVRHDERTDEARRYPPRGGVGVLVRAVFVQKADVERLGEVLPQIMRSARLQALAVVHHRLHAEGGDGAGELFFFRLPAREHGDGEAGLGEFLIDAEHLHRLFHRLFFAGVGGVAFLPQKIRWCAGRGGWSFPSGRRSPTG